jgi:hypothetical protein
LPPKLKAHYLQVTSRDGDEHKVAVPERRKKWTHVHDSLNALNWIEVRSYDKKNALTATFVLEGCNVEDDEDILADMTDDSAATSAALYVHTERMMKLFLRAQDVALQRQNQANKSLVDGATRLLEVSTMRTEALERIAQNLINENLSQARKLADAMVNSDEGGLMSAGMIEAIGPQIVARLMGGPVQAQVVAAPPANAQPAVPGNGVPSE